jgi:hypothetical protein
MDRTRASDNERETVVGLLRDAAAEGRLTIEELAERTGRAYAARTRNELADLLEDLPVNPYVFQPLVTDRSSRPNASPGSSRAAGWPGLRPSEAGELPFAARWRSSANPRKAASDVMKFIVPLLEESGYELVERTSDKLILRRQLNPVDAVRFGLGLGASARVTIAMTHRGDHSIMDVYGIAPQYVRAQLVQRADGRAQA